MNIVVTGGGTGGHLYPALTIAKELEKKIDGVNIIYIGAPNSIEEEIVTKNTNYEFISVEIEGLKGIKSFHKNINVLNKFFKASKYCTKILREKNIDAVIGTGGYVCAPVFQAAKKLNINYYIHEQNSVFGKVVKFYLKGSKFTFTSFDEMIKFDASREKNVIFAGNPQTVLARKKFTENGKKNQVVIFSGSMGGYYFNNNIKKIYPKLAKLDTEFIHIIGKNHECINSGYDNIKVIQYSTELMELVNNSKYVICRAGASTIAELIGLKKPAILIPSPFVAHRHQHKNASYLTNKKCALMCEEEDMVKRLVSQIEIFENNSRLEKAINNFDYISVTDSLDIIVNKISEV